MLGRALLLFICMCLLVGVHANFNDMKYENLLAEELQLKIRRLRQKLNLVEDPDSKEHSELTAALNKASRDLGNVRLLKKGVSALNAMHITALQHELDENREIMRREGNITSEQRLKVGKLAQQIQALKHLALVPPNNILPTGQPLDIQLETLFDRLERSRTLEDKRQIREQIMQLRRLRIKQMNEYIDNDMALIQGYRRQIAVEGLSDELVNLYQEKIDAAYETMKSHQQELNDIRHMLTSEEKEHNLRMRAHIAALRVEQSQLVDKSAKKALQERIDKLSTSIVEHLD